MKRFYSQFLLLMGIVALIACTSAATEPEGAGIAPTTIFDPPTAEPTEIVETAEESAATAVPIVDVDEVAEPAVMNGPLELPSTADFAVDVTLAVDVTNPLYPISPHIYGINFGEEDFIEAANIPVRRWGGNATTRYNWQTDVSNRASDWYFLNVPNELDDPDALPLGSAADRFIAYNESLDIETLKTMPMLGWMPIGRERSCSFSVDKYGSQQDEEPYGAGCGNGVYPDGSAVENDPNDVHEQVGPEFVQEWITHLADQFGTAAEDGVRYYSFDNEPMLWFHTHSDVRPEPLSYDGLRDLTYDYGAAIKEVDPNAETFGPVLWGWTAYTYSALDMADGGSWWSNPPDYKAHGNIPLAAWYLQEMARYEAENGVRILDYFDLHVYPQASGVALSNNVDIDVQELRLRSTRSLWDVDYDDESWIDEPVKLIPRMEEWVDQYYPETKLAITEYNWGAVGHINGALAQADILGIFGREQLDFATMWAPPEVDEPAAFSFMMYRNYDGDNGAFGETALQALSSDQDQVSIYAAVREGDSAVTIMVINKSLADRAVYVDLPLAGDVSAEVYRYSEQNLSGIERLEDRSVENGFSAILPMNSITLYVLP